MIQAKIPRMAAWGVILALLAPLVLRADSEPAPSRETMETLASSLQWQTGTITLRNGLAKLNLTSDFHFLDHANTEKVLHDLWRNPPDPDTLGMIFPVNVDVLDRN